MNSGDLTAIGAVGTLALTLLCMIIKGIVDSTLSKKFLEQQEWLSKEFREIRRWQSSHVRNYHNGGQRRD